MPRVARSMEDFRGDTPALCAFVAESWSENEQALAYTPDFISGQLGYPGAGPALAPTMYEDDVPVGFVAGFPRRVELNGRSLKLLVSALLSVAPRYKRVGLGGIMLGELAKRAQDGGFDGLVMYGVEGGPMNPMIMGLAASLKLPTAHVRTIGYQSRLLFPKRVEAGPAHLQAAERLVELGNAINAPLRRRWTRAEAEWQCAGRPGAVVELLEAEGRRGLLTGYVQQVADGDRPLCLFVDDILWGDLSDEERATLVKQFIARGQAAGARIVVIPDLGYADLAPFRAKPSPRVIHSYLSLFDGSGLPEGDLPAVYLDVF